MGQLREAQLRFVYSLLKPVVRAAARFSVPMRTLTELLRLSYFEHLRHRGLSQAEIARRLGQTDRHMRSLAQRLRGDFFAAERGEPEALETPDRYHVLSSAQFHHRIEALDQILDGMYRAVVQRLLLDRRDGAMVKAISFSAQPEALRAFVERFEGELRRGIAALEEEAAFGGGAGQRYTLGLSLAHAEPRPAEAPGIKLPGSAREQPG